MAKDELMTIPLVDGWNRIKLSQCPYPVGQKDRELINEILNELYYKGRIKWVTKPMLFATPVFIAWRIINGIKKSRVVADLRVLNKVIISDVYLLPLLEIIMAFLIGKRFITVVNIKLSFYQYGVYFNHRDYFTIIFYRDLEYLIITLIGFRNSPAYI